MQYGSTTAFTVADYKDSVNFDFSQKMYFWMALYCMSACNTCRAQHCYGKSVCPSVCPSRHALYKKTLIWNVLWQNG